MRVLRIDTDAVRHHIRTDESISHLVHSEIIEGDNKSIILYVNGIYKTYEVSFFSSGGERLEQTQNTFLLKGGIDIIINIYYHKGYGDHEIYIEINPLERYGPLRDTIVSLNS